MDEKLFSQRPGEASFVAVGDSFTEGLNDAAPDGGFVGWADRLAGLLAVEYPGLRYANLAVRGKLLREIVAEQVPAAAAMSPGLVSFAGGGNDIIRPGGDPDSLAELVDAAVARLRGAGAQVLIFTGTDPVELPVIRLLRGRIAAYNMHLRAIADARGCYLVDLWSMRILRPVPAWSPDRLHFTAQSHQRIALRACEVLGVPVTEDWRDPLLDGGALSDAGALSDTGAPSDGGAAPGGGAASDGRPLSGGQAPNGRAAFSALDPGSRAARLAARREDVRWAREHLAPWMNRRLHGQSSSAGRFAKRPVLEVVSPPVTL
jgi:lysophospholipase L1-like esterase